MFFSYGDILPDKDSILLILYALGSSDVPLELLRSIRQPHRCWDIDGELQSATAVSLGFPVGIINLVSDDERLSQALTRLGGVEGILGDGTAVCSLHPARISMLDRSLTARTAEDLRTLGLRMICFVCPPCFDSKDW